MATIYEMQQQRAALVKQMREVLDTADEAGRDLSAEERAKYDEMESDLEVMNEEIDAKQKALDRRAKLEAIPDPMEKPSLQPEPKRGEAKDEYEYVSGLAGKVQKAMDEGASRREAFKMAAKECDSKAMLAFRKWLQADTPGMRNQAALQMDSDTAGGTLVLPEQFVANLINGLDERVFMRTLGTMLPMTNAEAIAAPSLTADPADDTWTTELQIGDTDSTMTFGKRLLRPHPVGKLLKVSKTLLRRSAISVDQIVRDRLTHKMAVTQEKGFMTGSGSQQPLGVFTASSEGISTSQDVSTSNTTTAITADGLIEAKYGLAAQYHTSPNLRWIFHRTAIKQIRLLKSGDGQYLWQPGLQADKGNTILDVPYETSEYAPSTFTTGLYVGLIGDLSFFWIVESLAFSIEMLSELYAATNENGYIVRAECDGAPVLEESFIRVTLA